MVAMMLAPLIAMWERRTMAFEDVSCQTFRRSIVMKFARLIVRPARQHFADDHDSEGASDERCGTTLWKLTKLIY